MSDCLYLDTKEVSRHFGIPVRTLTIMTWMLYLRPKAEASKSSECKM